MLLFRGTVCFVGAGFRTLLFSLIFTWEEELNIYMWIISWRILCQGKGFTLCCSYLVLVELVLERSYFVDLHVTRRTMNIYIRISWRICRNFWPHFLWRSCLWCFINIHIMCHNVFNQLYKPMITQCNNALWNVLLHTFFCAILQVYSAHFPLQWHYNKWSIIYIYIYNI